MIRETSRRTVALVNVFLLIPIVLLLGGLAGFVVKHELYFLGCWSFTTFYAVPILLAALLALGFRLSLMRRAQFALAAWSTFASLYIGEIVLPIVMATPTDAQVRELACTKLGIPFDRRTKLQVVQDLRAAGTPAVPTISGVDVVTTLTMNGTSIFPLSGISNTLTVYGNENGQYVIYQSDECGFANPPGIFSLPKWQIAVVGDSFAHGAGVRIEKNSVSLIRQHFPSTVNLGYAARGPLAYLGTLTEYALERRPSLVLWFHFEGNDLFNLEAERRTLLANYLRDDFTQHLVNSQNEIDSVLNEVVEKWLRQSDQVVYSQSKLRRFATLQTLRNQLLAVCRSHDQRSEDDFSFFKQILSTAKQRVEQHGGEFYFVYLPAHERYVGAEGTMKRQERRICDVMSELDIPVINVARTFGKNPDPLALFPFRLNGHYSEDGYALVADTILKVIRPKIGASVLTVPEPRSGGMF